MYDVIDRAYRTCYRSILPELVCYLCVCVGLVIGQGAVPTVIARSWETTAVIRL